jgi:hypothetical protein
MNQDGLCPGLAGRGEQARGVGNDRRCRERHSRHPFDALLKVDDHDGCVPRVEFEIWSEIAHC